MYCTIVSPTINHKTVVESLNQHYKVILNSDDHDDCWGEACVMVGDHSLHLTSLVRKEPGDQFSNIVLGMYAHFRDPSGGNDPDRESLLHQIAETEWLIGVRGSEDLKNTESLWECVLYLAACLDSIIFDGNNLIDSSGTHLAL